MRSHCLKRIAEKKEKLRMLLESAPLLRPRHTVCGPGQPLDQFLVSPSPEHKKPAI